MNNSLFDILIVLSSSKNHGYAIIQEIEQLYEGEYKPSIGMLYVSIQKLIDMKYIEEASAPEDNKDPRRKYYQLTKLGSEELKMELNKRVKYLTRARLKIKNK